MPPAIRALSQPIPTILVGSRSGSRRDVLVPMHTVAARTIGVACVEAEEVLRVAVVAKDVVVTLKTEDEVDMLLVDGEEI